MATIDVANTNLDLTHPSAHAHVYQTGHIFVAVDFAAAAAKKGSALAAGDVLRIAKIPPKSVVAGGVLEVLVASGADLTTCTLNVGVENVDQARFISGFNYKTAAVGDFAADNGSAGRVIVGKTADYLVLTLATLTGALTTGKVNVGAGFLDISDPAKSAGLATRT